MGWKNTSMWRECGEEGRGALEAGCLSEPNAMQKIKEDDVSNVEKRKTKYRIGKAVEET